MSDEKKPITIRTKDGKKIDLASVRRSLDLRDEFDGCFGRGGDAVTRALLDALEAALSVPMGLEYEGPLEAYDVGFAAGVKTVRQAAGVIE